MAFTLRFGGWRPVQLEHGVGVLRLAADRSIEPVGYRFEVWHQVIDGFAGPYRSEGRLSLPGQAEVDVAGCSATLVLEDGRCLELRLTPGGALLGHGRPALAADPPS